MYVIMYITATSTDPSTSSTIASNFREFTVIYNASSCKSDTFATVVTDNGNPGMNVYEGPMCDIMFSECIDIMPENSVTSTNFT